MSALDKAFLRAYTKQTAAPAYLPDPPATGLPPGAYFEDVDTGMPMLVTQPYSDDTHHRFDAAHRSAEAAVGQPHAAFPGAAEYEGPAIVGSYYDPTTQALLSGNASPAEIAEEMAGEEIPQPDAAPAAAIDQPEPSPPAAVGESRQTVRKPDETRASAPLKLPSVFLPPEEFDDAAAFSPDWEVDRFAWPELCERLLDAESRYFRHVGERLKAATDESHHVVMVSGCRRGEGRTTLALCLARSAAAAGVEVALVDADWQNPQIGSRLGMETPCGWTEVLAGKAPLNEAAVASVEDRLTLFPLKTPGESPIQDGQRRLSQIVSRISAHFPLVIMDTGPLGGEDHPPFADEDECPVDAAIVVRDLRYTTEKKALATAGRLQQSGIAAVGIAENFETR
jgi:Mrp family chromosome partitioning ATPase